MLVLGIESSCDETAASIVKDGREIISSVVYSQAEEHGLYGGVVPEIASRRHIDAISEVVQKCFDEANCTVNDVDAIACTFAPGLIGALLVGVNFAKGLSYASGKPLVPTHHIRGHIGALYLTNKDLKPPFICLVASGGHSHIVAVEDYTKFRVIGDNLLPPLNSIPGLGENAAKALVAAREEEAFCSIDDLRSRGKVSKTIIDKMKDMGILEGLPESSQISLFDF